MIPIPINTIPIRKNTIANKVNNPCASGPIIKRRITKNTKNSVLLSILRELEVPDNVIYSTLDEVKKLF